MQPIQRIVQRNRNALGAAFAALSLALLAGCSSTPENAAPVDARGASTPAATTAPSGVGTAGASTQGLTAGTLPPSNVVSTTTGSTSYADGLDPALRDPNHPLSRRSIFFDYDSFVVKDEFRSLVETHAAYLKRSPRARIVIEGNTDERGSREYNLALGQKRSEAVKRVMSLLGVSETQLESISFGEEKPRNAALSEQAFAENRRADIRYAGE